MKVHSFQPLRILAATGFVSAVSFAAFPTLKVEPVVLQQLFAPTNITSAPDGSGRVFICDQPGKIHILQNGMILPVPFLDVGAKMVTLTTNSSERGLLGMAFHPAFADPASPGYRKFYLHYSAPSGTTLNPSTPQVTTAIISEFRVSVTNPNLADPLSERLVLSIGRPQSNHNGGKIDFGPDNLLYISSGDGGSANDNSSGHTGSGTSVVLGNGQDLRNLLGKILRIDPIDPDGGGPLTYSVPPSNPFVGVTQDFPGTTLDGPARGEIYAHGLRNPWRFSFDMRPGGTNRLFCGDVGQNQVEEVNIINGGGNYGWRYREGTFVFDAQMVTSGIAPASSVDPIAQYAHPGVNIGTPALPQLGISITGGYIYRGPAIPTLQGKYLFADYSTSTIGNTARVMGLEETAPGSFTLNSSIVITGGGIGNNPLTTSILTFGEDTSGELLLGTKSNGGVLQPAGGLPAGGIYQVVPENYQTPPYQTWRTSYFPTLKTGQYLDPEGDSDGDGIGNQIEYAYGFSPLVANTPEETGFSASRDSSDFTITFRRDPAATDLVYNLQTSPDLVTWTTIASSSGGASATGLNGGTVTSDAPFPGQAAFRLVTVRDDPGVQRFARLRTVR